MIKKVYCVRNGRKYLAGVSNDSYENFQFMVTSISNDTVEFIDQYCCNSKDELFKNIKYNLECLDDEFEKQSMINLLLKSKIVEVSIVIDKAKETSMLFHLDLLK